MFIEGDLHICIILAFTHFFERFLHKKMKVVLLLFFVILVSKVSVNEGNLRRRRKLQHFETTNKIHTPPSPSSHHHKSLNLHDLLSIHPLKDSLLCNNGPEQKEDIQCVGEQRQKIKCDQRDLPKEDDCQLLVLKLPILDQYSNYSFSHSLSNLFSDFDDHNSHQVNRIFRFSPLHELFHDLFIKLEDSVSYRRIIIQYSPVNYYLISNLVDEFLVSRPWLFISNESFPTALHSETTFSSTGEGHHHYSVSIDRYHQSFEPFLYHLGLIQYPDEETCQHTPMILNRNNPVHPGWTGVLAMYIYSMFELPYAVTAIYVSQSNKLNENTGFIDSKEDCPNHKNKWECSFLPSTNCSLPLFLTNCTKENCVAEIPESNLYFSSLYSNFTNTASHIMHSENNLEYEGLKTLTQQPRNEKQSQYSSKVYLARNPPQLAYRLPPADVDQETIATSGKKQHLPLLTMGNREFLYEQYFTRPNSFYRYKINELLQSFYSSNHLTSSSRCVAAHIRRGDRSIHGMNMTSYCDKGGHEDFGCRNVPFGIVSLTSIINKAKLLVSSKVKTLFVATDDPLWFENEKQHLMKAIEEGIPEFLQYKGWNLYALPPPVPLTNIEAKLKDPDAYNNYIQEVRSTAGTKSGVYFFSTFKLLSQCEGFVGHLGSGVSWMLYRSMCYKHGNRYMGVCPPGYDVRNGL
jgi:hypothetical protein